MMHSRSKVLGLALALGVVVPGSAFAQSPPVTQQVTNGTWTTSLAAVMNGPYQQLSTGPHMLAQNIGTVSAVWFSSMTNGVIAVAPDSNVVVNAGMLQHMSGPLVADSIVLNGHGHGGAGSPNHNAVYVALTPIPGDGRLMALDLTSAGDMAGSQVASFLASSDQGKTWTKSAFHGGLEPTAHGMPYAFGFPLALSKSTSGEWHELDQLGGTWVTKTAPGPSTKWTQTWHWPLRDEPPVPANWPKTGCQGMAQPAWQATSQPSTGPVAWIGPAGNELVYGVGGPDKDGARKPQGVCRSTDGGKSYTLVPFPNQPAGMSQNQLMIIQLSGEGKGIAAFGALLGSAPAWVYYTTDRGATWAKATIPEAKVDLIFSVRSPNGAIWLVGQDAGGPILWRSDDEGHTWTNQSPKIKNAFTLAGAANAPKANIQFGGGSGPRQLHSGFALDNNNLWLGADNGWLFYSSTGGQ